METETDQTFTRVGDQVEIAETLPSGERSKMRVSIDPLREFLERQARLERNQIADEDIQGTA